MNLPSGPSPTDPPGRPDRVATPRRDAIDVARVLALALVVAGHLMLAVIDRADGEVRGSNLLALHPGWAVLLAAAPMPVFFAAGGWANATSALTDAGRRLRRLAGIGAVVVTTWSLAVVVTVFVAGEPGIIGDGARLATQPLWFVAAYAPFAASGRWLARRAAAHPVVTVGGCFAALAVLDIARFGFGSPDWIGWPGFAFAWVVPWLVGGWWRDRVECGRHRPGTGSDPRPSTFPERRFGALLATATITSGIVLVHRFGYAPALIDAVPDARSNTTPPTLYTATIGLAQVGILMVLARPLDRVGRRWRRFWDRAGEAAVGVYAWHLTALALVSALVAAGLPVPERLTLPWWLTRPLWWAAILGLTVGLVLLTDVVGRRFRRPGADRDDASERTGALVIGVVVLTAGGAIVGLEGPRSVPLAVMCSACFIIAWLLLRGRTATSTSVASR